MFLAIFRDCVVHHGKFGGQCLLWVNRVVAGSCRSLSGFRNAPKADAKSCHCHLTRCASCGHAAPMRLGGNGWLADLWLFVTPTKRRAVCAQPHLRVTAAQAILKNLGWRFCSMVKLVFGMNQSLDSYVDHDHQEFA